MAKLDEIRMTFTRQEQLSRNGIQLYIGQVVDAVQNLPICRKATERTILMDNDPVTGDVKILIEFVYPQPTKTYKYTVMFDGLEIKVDAYPHEKMIMWIEEEFGRRGPHEDTVPDTPSVPYSVRKV